MAQQFDLATQNSAKFIKDNPGLFNGITPGNVLGQLGVVNPGLFGQLQNAYNSEGVGKGSLTEWGQQNVNYGQGLLDPKFNNGAYLPAETPNAVVQPTTDTIDPFYQDAQDRVNQLQASSDAAYEQAGQGLAQQIQNTTAPGRSKVISEEAALGRLDSPVSIPQLGRYDEGVTNSIGSGLTQLKANQASGDVSLAKTISDILGSQASAKQSSDEFGRALNERGRQFDLSHQLESILGQNKANLDARNAEESQVSGFDQNLNRANTASSILSNLFPKKK